MRANTLPTKFEPIPFTLSLLITLGIAYVASLFTRPEIAGWYSTLNKPTFNPPSWLFAPVWITLYIIIAISAYIIWKKREESPVYTTTVVIYIVQLLLNFSWSIVFFGLHQILAGLIIILALLFTIILNINWFGRFSKTAAWMLVPYLLWVCFATLLNLSIHILNN